MSRRFAATILGASLLLSLSAVDGQALPSGLADAKPAVAKHHKAASAAKLTFDHASATPTPAASDGGGDGQPATQPGASASAPTTPASEQTASSPAASASSSAAASRAASAPPAESAQSAAEGGAPASGASSANAPAESFPITENFGIFLLALAVAAPAVLLGLGYRKERKQAVHGPSSPAGIVWWGVAFVMAATSVIYAYARRETIGFWDGMVGSWLATLLGIVCGVPVALELERQRKRAEEAAKAEAAKKVRAQVLDLLRVELERVADQLKERSDTPLGLPIEPLKTSMWDATRASGNLAAVSEPDLLQAFSEAYRWIGMIVTLEAQRIELIYGNDRLIGGNEYASVKLEALIREFLPPATTWVDHALAFTASATPTPTAPTSSLRP